MNQEQSAAALDDFINDFKLRNVEGIVSFNAAVHLFFKGRLVIFESEVQIISSNHLDTLYVISVPTASEKLPDMFDPKEYNFAYSKHDHLRLTPSLESGRTFVSIFPR